MSLGGYKFAGYKISKDADGADFTGNYASWSDTILKGRPSGSNYYYKVVICVE